MSRAFLLAVLLAGCAPAPVVPYRLDAMQATAPELPEACDDAPAPAGDRWLVFVQDDCVTCKAWLDELSDERSTLDAAGVTVDVAVVGAGRCAEAYRVAGRYPFSRRSADDADESAWVVTSTPVTYRIAGGEIRGRLEGRRPLETLRASGWLPAR